MSSFLQWVTTWSVGDLVSLLALLIAIWQIQRAKSIAEQVRSSVTQMRDDLRRKTVTADLHELIRDLEEIKEMHRSENLAILPRRYTGIRIRLASVRSAYGWSTKQKTLLQQSVAQFATFEQVVESSTEEDFSARDLNAKVNQEIDKLVALIAALQNVEGIRNG